MKRDLRQRMRAGLGTAECYCGLGAGSASLIVYDKMILFICPMGLPPWLLVEAKFEKGSQRPATHFFSPILRAATIPACLRR